MPQASASATKSPDGSGQLWEPTKAKASPEKSSTSSSRSSPSHSIPWLGINSVGRVEVFQSCPVATRSGAGTVPILPTRSPDQPRHRNVFRPIEPVLDGRQRRSHTTPCHRKAVDSHVRVNDVELLTFPLFDSPHSGCRLVPPGCGSIEKGVVQIAFRLALVCESTLASTVTSCPRLTGSSIRWDSPRSGSDVSRDDTRSHRGGSSAEPQGISRKFMDYRI